MVSSPSRELIDAFAAFRRGRRAADELTTLERRFSALGNPAYALNSEHSRRIHADGGAEAVLVPGDQVVAVIEAGGGGVVGLFQMLDGDTIGTAFRGNGRLLVSGVMPDGVTEVVVMRRDRSTITVPVHDHLLAVEVLARRASELPAEVVFVQGGRERRFSVPGADAEILSMRSSSEIL